MLLRLLAITAFFTLSVNTSAELITFNKADNSVKVIKDQMNIIDFLVELENQSGIAIQCDPSVPSGFELPLGTFTLQQVLHALESKYSTILGYDSNGAVKSLDVLPQSSSTSDRKNAVPVMELHQKKLAQNTDSSSNEIPAYIDLNNVSKSDWESLNKEQAKALRKALRDKKAKESRAEFRAKRVERVEHFRSILNQIKEEQPELYPIYYEQYKDMITLPDSVEAEQ